MVPGAMGRLKPGLTIGEAQARLMRSRSSSAASIRWNILSLVPVEEDLVGNMRQKVSVYERLEDLKIALPKVTPPVAAFVPFLRSGNLIFSAVETARRRSGAQ
jgi:hypothetical protein